MDRTPENECLDLKVCAEMEKLADQLTESGKPVLNADVMKSFKRICRISDLYVKHAFHILMTKLEEDHSEVRLSAFQMVDELFNRSHAFRELLVSEFQRFLELTVEVDFQQPLPPPKAAADSLRTNSLKAIQQWQEKYGEAYKKLKLGFNYLSTCKHVNFANIRARTLAEQKRQREDEIKKKRIAEERIKKVLSEVEDVGGDIENSLKEVQTCFDLLLPSPENFFIKTQDDKIQKDQSVINKKNEENLVTGSSVENSDTHNGSDISGAKYKNENSTNQINSVTDTELDETGQMAKNSKPENRESSTSSLSVDSTKCDSLSKKDHSLVNGDNVKTEDSDKNNAGNSNVNGDSENIENGRENHLEADHHLSEDEEDDDDDDDESDEEDDMESVDEDFFVQQHGLGTHRYNITIDVNPGPVSLQETEDNQAILTTLKDLYRLIVTKYFPTVQHWLQVLSKYGAKQDDMKKVINLKSEMENTKKQFHELNIVPEENTNKGNDSDDSEEEFEEVPEKEGYEAHIPAHLRSEYGLEPLSGTSTSEQNQLGTAHLKMPPVKKHKPARGQSLSTPGKKATPQYWDIKCRVEEDSADDPASLKANLKRLVKDILSPGPSGTKTVSHSISNEQPGTSNQGEISRKERLLQKAPLISYGIDLEHWENPESIVIPMVEKYESLLRFWTPSEDVSVVPEKVCDRKGNFRFTLNGQFNQANSVTYR